jgi:hypothetical protein
VTGAPAQANIMIRALQRATRTLTGGDGLN